MRNRIVASLIALAAALPASAQKVGSPASLAGPAAALNAAASGAPAVRAAAPLIAAGATPWSTVSAKVLAIGAYSDQYSPLPATYGLTAIDGPETASHRANYVNLWGSKMQSGGFEVESASLVSENWTLEPADRWSFDQWLFTLKPDGSFDGITHRVIVEKASGSGSVISIDYDPQAGADPAGFQAKALAEYDALLKLWNAYQPK